MLKICIWMNIPSHYQNDFFQALDKRDDVDLRVVYFDMVPQDRMEEGWTNKYVLKRYETFIQSGVTIEQFMHSINDCRDFIHVSSDNFSPELIEWFCSHDVKWCHWSEMPGIRLAEVLGYDVGWFRLFHPVMLACKKRKGRMLSQYAVRVFTQGYLARKAYAKMGVSSEQLIDLYYSPAPLKPMSKCEEIVRFASGRKVFLSVGVLCKRKGIDLLLKAFARLQRGETCLVLCGLDRSGGRYEALARQLGIEDRVLFLGAYPTEKMGEVYDAADVFVLASRFDGWGAVLNEAASVGLPLIGSDLCGASWEVIAHGVNGYRVKTGSVRALGDAMNTYVKQPNLQQVHGEASRERFSQKFSPDRNAHRLVDALQPMRMPLVSVVIPTYKRFELLQRAIESVFQQTYDNWELIISDNEVPAGVTWAYLTELAGDHQNITIVQNPDGGGCAGNVNNALKHAKGEWIKPLFDDDVLVPECLDAFVSAVSAYPNVVLAGCLAYRIRPNKRTRTDRCPTRAPLEVVEQRYAHLAMYLQDYECGGVPSQMFIRKSAIDVGAIMPKPPSIEGAIDSYWYAEILKHGDRLHLSQPLVREYQGGHETLTSFLGDDVYDIELLTYRRYLHDFIPSELHPPSLAVIEQMVIGIKGLYKLFILRRLNAGMKMLFKVRHPHSMWLIIKWIMRRSFPGYFTATPRLRQKTTRRDTSFPSQKTVCR